MRRLGELAARVLETRNSGNCGSKGCTCHQINLLQDAGVAPSVKGEGLAIHADPVSVMTIVEVGSSAEEDNDTATLARDP